MCDVVRHSALLLCLTLLSGSTARRVPISPIPADRVADAGVARLRGDPPAITDSGSGPETYVLLSGMAGGVAGYRRIGRRLIEQGYRVLTIDPYQLSMAAPGVSFDALARRVEAELAARNVESARVVGHAHGGGVGLRLAANAPHRVGALFLLDVGALAVNRTAVFSAGLSLVPFITKLPWGRALIRDRFLKGLRENSGRTDWLDDSTARAYAEPILDNIGPVVSFARRLASAREPEPLATVVARIRVPVTLLLGEVKGPASPGIDELLALAPLGAGVRTELVSGAGHFPHEERPDEVVRLLGRRTMAHPRSGAAR